MKRRLAAVLAVLLTLAMMVSMTACGSKQQEEAEEEEAIEEAITEEAEEGPGVVYSIEDIDTEDEPGLPLQISSITLFDDGTVLLVPTDDLRKNEMKEDPDAQGIYPFADSGKVKDVYLLYYGNAGFRTILAVLEDGTISAVNGAALVEDHIIAVLNNVAGRDDFDSVENRSDESAWYVTGITRDGEEVILDYSLNFTN